MITRIWEGQKEVGRVYFVGQRLIEETGFWETITQEYESERLARIAMSDYLCED